MTAGFYRLRSRPRLLATLTVLALLFAVNTIQNSSRTTAAGTAGPTDVAIIHIDHDPSSAEIHQMVRDAVAAAGGLSDIVKPGMKVMVQPNLTNAGLQANVLPGGACITNPEVTREVVRICQELVGPTGQVMIGEGSAAPFSGANVRGSTWQAFHDAGYDVSPQDHYDDATGARLIDFNDVGQVYPNFPGYSGPYNTAYVQKVTLADRLLRSEYWLNNDLMAADVVIRVPVFKNHNLAGTTGALKLAVGTAPSDIYHYPNMNIYKWGLMHQPGVLSWDGKTYVEYEQNARAIVDLNRCKPAEFVVCDATRGVTNGPVGDNGTITLLYPTMKCILAGRDPVAVDTIQALMQGYDPDSIAFLGYASGESLGTMDTSQITVRGTHVVEVRANFPAPYAASHVVRADSTPPVVGAVYPADGSVVSGTVGLTATGVYDNQGDSKLAKAELYVDGQLVGTDSLFDPTDRSYTIQWDSTSVADGTHTLQVYVYDSFLNENVEVVNGQLQHGITRTVTVDNSGNSVANALSQGDGSPVWLGQLVVTAQTNNGYLYAEPADRSMGLKIMSAGAYSEGNLIDVSGTMAGGGAERYLNANYINVVNPSVPVPAPFGIGNNSLGGVALNELTPGVPDGIGPYNFGLLVRSWGEVKSVGADLFYISDGSKAADGSWTQVLVKAAGLSLPNQGDFVTVTGVSVPDGSGRGLLARKQGDIIVR